MSSSVLLILLNLCSLTVTLVAMPTTCRLRGNLVNGSLKLLRELGDRDLPVACRPYNHNVSFPESAFTQTSAIRPQCCQALSVVCESLEGAELLFRNYTPPDAWDEFKLDDFRNLQNQLLEQEQCFSDRGSSGVLSSYFSNMMSVLDHEDGSVCGWALLKRDLLTVLNSAVHKHHNCLTWKRTPGGSHTH